MKKIMPAIMGLAAILFIHSLAFAMETVPHISDLEIVERLTRLEEGQGALREEVKQLREDMNKQFDRTDAQFDRIVNIMLGILGAFAAMCGGTIWFALWDRRTMIRPFEDKVKKTEDYIFRKPQEIAHPS